MKKTVALLFLLSFAAQSFCQALIIADFYINQSKIAATKCENRSRPMLRCNGKCQLVKKLKQEEKKNEQNPERKQLNKSEVVSSKSFFGGLCLLYGLNTNIHILLSDNRIIDRSGSFFHPPGA